MITDDDIRRAIAPNAFQAGLHYQRERRVRDLRIAADGNTFDAQVLGSSRSPYSQFVRLVRTPDGTISASGSCTCPVGSNCKHVAAVLFEYQRRAPGVAPGGQVDRRVGQGGLTVASAEASLPHDVAAWLHSLDAAQEEESEDYPPTVRKRLLYVCDRRLHSGSLVVDVQSIELRRDGTPGGGARRHQVDRMMRAGRQPKFLRPSDRAILRRIAGPGVEGEAIVDALQGIIATGRGRWGAWDGPVLTQGEPVAGEIAWRLTDDGRQRRELALPGALIALRLSAPWYVDPATGAMGPVETALPPRLIRAMLDSPALPHGVAGHVREEMDRRWLGRGLPAPTRVAPPRLLREPLQPHLL